jgi:preprotein translocase subunit SecA
VPEDEWKRTVEDIENKEKMREEGRRVAEMGGLHIIGTERHDARRIDNQLRGRAGRQGDPGSSRFYLSLEDDLMRIFGSDRIQGLMGKLGMEEGEAIEHRMVSKAIERAQKQVEAQHFGSRKQLLEYDDVMNKQREAIYKLRRDILEGAEGREYVLELVSNIVDSLLETHCSEKIDPEDWDLKGLRTELLAYFNLNAQELGFRLEDLGIEELRETLTTTIQERYAEREARHEPELFRGFERWIMLQAVDTAWKDHLLALDHLKEGIFLRGYAQRDPLNEYKRESFELFQSMKDRVEDDIVEKLYRYEPVTEEQRAEQRRRREAAQMNRIELSAPPKVEGPSRTQPTVNKDAKVGRNDPCPCGSGKKYKKCHGAAVTVG